MPALSRRALSLIVTAVLVVFATIARADNKALIDYNTQEALGRLLAHASDADELFSEAAAVLVFPDVIKMGFGSGGQYGEGALLVKSEPVAYYATAGSTFGLQSTPGYKAEVIVFMTEQALVDFRNRQGWEVGVHGTVPLVQVSAGGSIDIDTIKEPLVGFIFSDEGLIPDLTMHGSRITRIAR